MRGSLNAGPDGADAAASAEEAATDTARARELVLGEAGRIAGLRPALVAAHPADLALAHGDEPRRRPVLDEVAVPRQCDGAEHDCLVPLLHDGDGRRTRAGGVLGLAAS